MVFSHSNIIVWQFFLFYFGFRQCFESCLLPLKHLQVKLQCLCLTFIKFLHINKAVTPMTASPAAVQPLHFNKNLGFTDFKKILRPCCSRAESERELWRVLGLKWAEISCPIVFVCSSAVLCWHLLQWREVLWRRLPGVPVPCRIPGASLPVWWVHWEWSPAFGINWVLG